MILLSRYGRSEGVWKCSHGAIFKSRIDGGNPRRKFCPCVKPKSSQLKHGESIHRSRTREYNIWRLMRQRCNDRKNKAYPDYGGRGISVCERWNDFSKFLNDMGRAPAGFSIDRIDVDGDYSPENCRWTDNLTQQNNRRVSRFFEFGGKKRTMPQWSRELDINQQTLWWRINNKWPLEMVFNK